MASKPSKPATKKARAVKAARLSAAGANSSQIADELGISRTTAWRILRAEETQQVLVALVNDELEVLKRLFRSSLDVLADAMAADRPETRKGKELILGGTDHYARLTAVRELRHLLLAGRPKPRPAEAQKPRGILLSELTAEVAPE